MLEDDLDIQRLIVVTLSSAGYATRAYQTAEDVIADAFLDPPSLFLLDIMVPGTDGIELCQRLRGLNSLSAIPIVFLTARASEADLVLGLEVGADDYITKPFGTRELIARVNAVLRRFERSESASVIRFGSVEIDQPAMQLRVNGALQVVTATEFRLLEYFAKNPRRVFSRDQLLDAVWGDARFVTPRSVDVYVRRIREKIESDPENPRHLLTMRGAGYRFELTPQGGEHAS